MDGKEIKIARIWGGSKVNMCSSMERGRRISPETHSELVMA
jgi:hypothetical protein